MAHATYYKAPHRKIRGFLLANKRGPFPVSIPNIPPHILCNTMKDDKGKIILSLLAGATAGIVAGLLLAPETGDETRSSLRQSASKWGGDLRKLLKDTLAKVPGETSVHSDADAAVSEDKQAADRLLRGLSNAPTAQEAAVLTDNPTSIAGNTPPKAHLTEQ